MKKGQPIFHPAIQSLRPSNFFTSDGGHLYNVVIFHLRVLFYTRVTGIPAELLAHTSWGQSSSNTPTLFTTSSNMIVLGEIGAAVPFWPDLLIPAHTLEV